jgi:Na+/H+ antiporter NhaD/arsenite permease-like protein
MSFTNWLTLFVVVVILAGIAIGRFPILRMNRATIALVGATILIATGAISLPQAYAALDMNTLVPITEHIIPREP